MKKFILSLLLSSILIMSTGCLARLDANDKIIYDQAMNTTYDIDAEINKYRDNKNNVIYKLDSEKGISYMIINHSGEDVHKINQIHIIQILNDTMSDIQKGSSIKNSKELGDTTKEKFKNLKSISFDYIIAKDKYYMFVDFDRDIFKTENVKKEDYKNILSDDMVESNFSSIEKILLEQGFKKI